MVNLLGWKAPARPSRHVAAWYSYAFASEVFAACALAIFLPITLEQLAREVGFVPPDLTEPCSSDDSQEDGQKGCKARILGVWVDTASFSMYVKSIAVAVQALCIVTIGPLADSPYWRKRILLTAAYTGAFSALVLLLFPSSPHALVPPLAAVLTIIGNAGYATSIVCANSFLPGLAREEIAAEGDKPGRTVRSEGEGAEDEERRLLASPDVEAEGTDGDPLSLSEAVRAISTQDLAERDQTISSTALSLKISRLSSTSVALGFLSGVGVLVLLTIPISLMGGTTRSLRLAIGLSGLWWAAFTVPSWLGLPGGAREAGVKGDRADRWAWMTVGWKRVGGMVRWREMKRLPNLYGFLLAWVFLSDGFHTTTYTAILYASSTLRMGPSKIIVIGVLVQLAAVVSSVFAPRVQARLAWSNTRLLLCIVALALLLPLYACIGLILPFGGLRTEGEMYVAATWFGILYGPFNSYSRAVYAELIPPGHESTFFSLFSLTDKSSSFFGPAIVGIIADATGNIRVGFVFLLGMLAVPIPVLLRVSVTRGAEEARVWAESLRRNEQGDG